MSERFKLIATVHLFFRRGEEILLLRRANTGYEDGKYGLVAGHVDGNESLTQAMIREAKEESGVDVAAEDLVFKMVMHRRQSDERIDFFFEAKRWSGEISNAEPRKCDDLSWFPLDQLPKNIIPYIREAVQSYRDGVFYSEFGWEQGGRP